MLERMINVRFPQTGSKERQFQAVGEGGLLITSKCTQPIYSRILGERNPNTPTAYGLGLRQLVHVRFRALYDKDDVVVGLDIIPNRMFTSGAAPAAAGVASRRGFDVHWDEEINGFDVRTEHPVTGEPMRIAYAGMSETQLCDLLDLLRDHDWGSRKLATLMDHRIDKQEDGSFKVKPVKKISYTT